MSKLYFLGPKGTYSEVGAKKALDFLSANYQMSAVSTISLLSNSIVKLRDVVTKTLNFIIKPP